MWRYPQQVLEHSLDKPKIDKRLLSWKEKGSFWDLISEKKIQLIVSREYEHLLLTLGSSKGQPQFSFMSIPHPSGIAVDHKEKKIYVASTRNPNQIYTFRPNRGFIKRGDVKQFGFMNQETSNALVPVRVDVYPGSLYIHDLISISGKLYANAVGHNAVVELKSNGEYAYVWWPLCVDEKGKPKCDKNYLQLNSIAVNTSIKDSYFTASTANPIYHRPGQRNFPVNQRGVIFEGLTRKPLVYGLTRPHSAKLYGRKLWVCNSGYGQFGFINGGKFESIVALPGWTRGLCLYKQTAFIGVSKVIPRFRNYAPGLIAKKSLCGIYALDLKSGKIIGSISWPRGNQIYGIEQIPNTFSVGFPFDSATMNRENFSKRFFYTYTLKHKNNIRL